MEIEQKKVNLGTCCACRIEGSTVRNIVMLNKRAPVSRTGWGCYICELKNDGALAVLCDACVEKKEDLEIFDVCYGYPSEGKRAAYASLLSEPFEHDKSRHEEFDLLMLENGNPMSAE